MGFSEQAQREPSKQRQDRNPEYLVDDIVDDQECARASYILEDLELEDLLEDKEQHRESNTAKTGTFTYGFNTLQFKPYPPKIFEGVGLVLSLTCPQFLNQS